ncbi:MAG: hypothetical protein ACR2PT_19525 [Endozoicomonas sp.]
MYLFHSGGWNKPVNIKADQVSFSWFHKLVIRCLMICVSMLVFFSAGQTWAGAELCSRYHLPELKSLCARFPSNQVTVHRSVADNDLNSLRDGWDADPGLHILPPGAYPLSRAIELDANQAILPHPTSQLPSNQAIRTIQLQAASDFSVRDNRLYLLKLKPGSAAGGIEIHSGQLSDALLSTTNKSLLWIESGGQVELVGSYLTAIPSDKPLEQLIQITTPEESHGSSSTLGDVRLERNLLNSAASNYGLVAHLQEGQQLTVKNSLIRLSSQGATGIAISRGTGVVANSAFVIEGRCSFGKCTGVSLNQTGHRSVSRNAFWTTLSNPWMAQGVSLDDLNTTGFSSDKGSLGWMATNLFSPKMGIMVNHGSSYDSTLAVRQFRSEYLKRQYPMNAVQFFEYTGELGVTYLASQVLHNACHTSNSTGENIDPLPFQKEARFSNSSFDLYYPPAIPPCSCVEPNCIDASQAVSYLIAAEYLFGMALTFVTSMLCCIRGRYLRPSVPYQGVSPDST